MYINEQVITADPTETVHRLTDRALHLEDCTLFTVNGIPPPSQTMFTVAFLWTQRYPAPVTDYVYSCVSMDTAVPAPVTDDVYSCVSMDTATVQCFDSKHFVKEITVQKASYRSSKDAEQREECYNGHDIEVPRTPSRGKISFDRWATVAERLTRSPPNKANRVQSPAGSTDFSKWESCRTLPLVSGFSRGSPVSPAPSIRHRSIFTSITLIGSQDLARQLGCPASLEVTHPDPPLRGTMRSRPVAAPFWESREYRQRPDLLASQTSSRLLEFPIRLATTQACFGEAGWLPAQPSVPERSAVRTTTGDCETTASEVFVA
ncbi:hypothetical protein PR048_024317 [Dryococelus australis]|uniref:Uncharacterized protein n=1 Tax=Dryococelus australis TaxID=614101 RepID=A0ABQ9GN94_9NEOP|nr:hypothetical protein PR048_024317 [Dryococelus australis]